MIAEIQQRARARVPASPGSALGNAAFRAAVDSSVAYLESAEALRTLERDPYWPKWTSPWWHMTLLHELGLGAEIPSSIADRMLRALETHFIHFFPFRLEEVPDGVDPYRNIVCHCALGTMIQVLEGRGLDVDRELPWAREWILRYQLPDGGLNCDEEAYVRPTPRSSMVSTLPPAEALLLRRDRPLNEPERSSLSGAASYLCQRGLLRSLSGGGAIIDSEWLTPCFPRFYFYDVLRGLRFLAGWAQRCQEKIAWTAVSEVVTALDAWFESPDELMARRTHLDRGTLEQSATGSWQRVGAAPTFPLLEATRSGVAVQMLRQEWVDVLEQLGAPGILV